ncbi:MAG: uracil-DNA glycosylase, partial [Thermotogae bacterium]
MMDAIKSRVEQCFSCPLSNFRTNTVLGEGDLDAPIMFVGEGPGADEDKTGRPFVGRAGQLLTKILESVEIKREQVYICNVVKCRPPGNRVPSKEEQRACAHFLLGQIAVINP